jgi:hypothetical protein
LPLNGAAEPAVHRRILLVQRLNPLSLPLALAWSLFAPVYYWRSEYVPAGWLRRFERLDPADYFTLEAWHDAIEAAYLAWRDRVAARQELLAVSFPLAGRNIDFSRGWAQWLAIGFEERYLFLETLRRRGGAGHVAGMPIDTLDDSLPAALPRCDAARLGSVAILDRVWLGLLAVAKAAKQAVALFRRAGTASASPCDLLWTGISANEFADAEQRLDLTFAAQRGFVDRSRTLYFLPSKPREKVAERLAAQGIRWTTVSAFGFLPRAHRLNALAELGAVVLRALWRLPGGIKSLVAARLAAESVPWVAAAQSLGAATHLASVSVCWPEPPEAVALDALGLRTVNWSYGANTFHFSQSSPAFKDLALSRSITTAREVWVWNADVLRLLQARALMEPPVIRVTGPAMCGDARWLACDPEEARARFGLQPGARAIAVFDVPPVTREMRLAIGHGPSAYPAEMLEQFFRDVETLLEEFPQAVVIVKPKRSFKDTRRQFAESMQRILHPESPWAAAGRVIGVPHDIDPYIPVALAELSLGVPFTSPVIAAMESGRHGVFHDPLGSVTRVPGAPGLLAHTTHSSAELVQRVAALLERPVRGHLVEEPAKQFATLLRG